MLLRQTSYVVTLGLFAVLCLWAGGVGLSAVHHRNETITALQSDEDAGLDQAVADAEQEESGHLKLGQFRDPRDVSNFVRVVLNVPVTKPMRAAFVLHPAAAEDQPWYFNLNLGPQSKQLTAYEYSNPEAARLGPIDLAFVLAYLLPLFLIFSGYAVWTSDREVHLDRLVTLGRSTNGWTYARRLLLCSSPYCAIYCLLASLTVIAVPVRHAAMFDRLVAIVCFTTLAALYTAFWYVGIYLTIRSSRLPSASLIQLLLGWVCIVVVVPSLAQWNARTMYRQISRSALLDHSRRNADDLAKRLPLVQQRYLDRHPESHLQAEDLKQSPSGGSALILAEANDELTESQENAVASTMLKQQSIVRWWALLSPALAVQEAAAFLAGEDVQSEIAFKNAARAELETLRAYFRPLLFRHGSYDRGSVEYYVRYRQEISLTQSPHF